MKTFCVSFHEAFIFSLSVTLASNFLTLLGVGFLVLFFCVCVSHGALFLFFFFLV